MDRREFVKSGAVTLALLSAREKASTQPLKGHLFRIAARLNRYENATVQATSGIELDIAKDSTRKIGLECTTWHCFWKTSRVADRPDALDLVVSFKLATGAVSNCAAVVELEFDNWSTANYVCLPSAVYNGNRFHVQPTRYPPMIDKANRRPDLPITINDFPRLNIGAGESRLEEFTGNLATPAVGIYSPPSHTALWLLTDQQTQVGNSGITVEESLDRSKATVSVTAPRVRHTRQTPTRLIPSSDRGATFNPGDEITLRLRLYTFRASDLQVLFDRFLEVRKDLTGRTAFHHMIPMSQAFSILEDKLNRENWSETWGFYTLGWQHAGDSIYSLWQLGWAGGIQNTLALLLAGSEISRQRAWKNLDTIITRSQAPSGFFYGVGDGEKWLGDDFNDISNKDLCLARKNADALFFFLKQFSLLKKQGRDVPKSWETAVRRLADAFVILWKKCGQFGQFINVATCDIIIGGTASAAIAPAGLALASQYYGNAEYLSIAEQSARLYYTRDVQGGVTTGGPGDALQAPDSESSYALIESFILLYEMTGKAEWLKAAREQAAQFAIWIVSYDYKFPEKSTFGRLGMRTTGTCWANGQNRHSTPAICTGSGDALLRLYRITEQVVYLELMRDIVQTSPQYWSRADRTIQAMERGKLVDQKPGWIVERVQMSDWENPCTPIGEVFHASSSWYEAALTLSSTEIPGLYVQPDTGFAWTFDHIDAQVLKHSGDSATVRLTNRTPFPARIRAMVESSTDVHRPLNSAAIADCPVIELAAAETREIVFDARHRLSAAAGSHSFSRVQT
jgi:hypothetical protein